MGTLSKRGRAVRLTATALGFVLLLVGTVRGTDDDFPFGPFRMYSTSDPPDAPAPDTRVEGVDRTGAVVELGQDATGIRRAEIEGQQGRYAADPTLLRQVADAYAERHPGAPELVEVRIVVRWYDIRGGRPTGRWSDETAVRWQAAR
ncbi:hypothetical protein DLE60_30380 [Micromonospora globispora]|uniref:Uncharacterized protein n=1 Tax=Micromonospora globispora TaxID=1450148 RepID=A0A317KFG3_9ACTN|nr:hypothetical protein [Micromonospora globispora]PWU51118.1 hypothetical protein DLJ46_05490 [Micromonospora globispora]PWU53789.1 hypothetical protein DLE60_30380 [Micromonospora globispora]RQW82915.1 hypothetical protein DKL51_32345 [Micromonospora globispora]